MKLLISFSGDRAVHPVGSAAELEKRRKSAVRRMRAGEQKTDVATDLGDHGLAITGNT